MSESGWTPVTFSRWTGKMIEVGSNPWRRWFAWYPVLLVDGGLSWMHTVEWRYDMGWCSPTWGADHQYEYRLAKVEK